MSRHDPLISIQQMCDHAKEAVAFAEGRSRADLDSDRGLELILTRLLEIIGEAANRVPKAEQAKYADIPWPQIISLRNRIIHGYDQVDRDIVWRIVSEELQPLVETLNTIIGSNDDR